MAKYIDANKVIDYANQEVTAAFYYPQDAQEQRKRDEQAYREKWTFVKQVMIDMPSADVTEVRHGRWVKGDEMADYPRVPYKSWEIYCSCCGEIKEQGHDNFCGNCGAKIGGVSEDE